MKKVLYVLMVLGVMSSCQAQSGKGVTTKTQESTVNVLSVSAYKAMLATKGIQLIDVRTPAEFSEGHISGAKNVNVTGGDFAEQVQSQLDKNKPVALYCRSGSRSQTATAILKELGFKKIYDLQGGYLAWSRQ